MKPILKLVITLGLSILMLNAGYLTAQFTTYDLPYPEIKKLTDAERFSDAEKAIDAKLKVNAKDPSALYQKGYLKSTLEDYDAAITAHQEGIKGRSKYPFNHVALGKAYAQKGMIEEAKGAFEQAIKVNKKGDHNVLIELADAYLAADMRKEAEIVLYRVREENGDDARSYKGLGEYYLDRVDELAKKYFIQAIEKDPSFIKAYLPLGEISVREAEAIKIKDKDDEAKIAEKRAERKGLFNEGLKYLNKAVELDPNFAPSYKERGELYLKAGMYDEARDDYKKYVELLPNDDRAKYRYAQFLYLSENYQESIDMLNSLEVQSLVKTRLLGYSYTELGKVDEAQKYIDQYFKDAPEDKVIPQDYENLASLSMKKGDNEQAMKHLMTMLDMKGEENKCAFFEDKAREYKRKKDYVMQAVYLEGMISCKGEDAKLGDYYGLGYAYYREKNYVAAQPAFAKCTEMKPDWEAGWYFKGSSIFNNNTDDPEYAARADFEEVFSLLSAKPVGELKKSEKSHLTTAATYLAFYHFYPVKKDAATADDYHCSDAQSYVSKVLELDPANSSVAQITQYCEQLEASGGGK